MTGRNGIPPAEPNRSLFQFLHNWRTVRAFCPSWSVREQFAWAWRA